MSTEALHPDGSLTTIHEGGGFTLDGGLAIQRFRLITAKQALNIYIRTEGRMELTRGGANASVVNVIAPLTGKKYARSVKGKREALADCEALIAQIDSEVVILHE